jgi:hypothetical protein
MDQFAAIVRENYEILKEYHEALDARDSAKIDAMRDAIARCDLFRKIAKEEILAHQATHASDAEASA